MLQSFRGTLDAHGIRSLRIETGDECWRGSNAQGRAEFWAVLNDSELPIIRANIQAGDRWRAMKLLNERAVCLGSVLPTA